MKTKPVRLTDSALLDACRHQAQEGSVFLDTKIAEERRKVTQYYLGKAPLPMREGGSKFISQDVYLSVETMKAEIVETFGAGSKIVQFSPEGPDDVKASRHATAYCEYAIHRRNDGLLTFQDVVHDGLTCRAGIAKVYWDKREEVQAYTLDNVPYEQAAVTLSDPNIRLTSKPKVTEGDDGLPRISVDYDIVTDCSQVTFEAVPPEEFILGGRTRSIDKARYLAHRYRVTLGELIADGYDPKIVYSITDGEDDLSLDPEVMMREEETLTGLFSDEGFPDQASKIITVYESYIRLDYLGIGTQQLWRVVHSGSVLLEKQRVSDHPFLSYTPQPIPHTFWGNNFAARTIPHANTKTTLTRAIIEQAVEATNPRWQVARGGVANPRELLDNRRGGVVNVRDVNNSVATLPQAPINPYVLQTIQMVDSDREDTTGISRLSQGLDKKALSHQNSKGLVEHLSDASKTRTKVIARNFAMQFVSQLYLKVYKLALENESKEHMLEFGGDFVPITPSTWRTRRNVAVDMTLGYGERDQVVADLADLHTALERSPKLGRVYSEKQAHALWRDILTIKGIKNVSDYLADPETLGEPQPDPEQQAKVAKLNKEAEVLDRQQTLREEQVRTNLARDQAELEWKMLTGQTELGLRARDTERKEREAANRMDIGLAELELAIEAGENAEPGNTKLTAIASPNS